mgnify:CR=1 FL=1
MMKKNISILLGCCAVFFAACSHAESGFSLGGQIGYATEQPELKGFSPKVSFKHGNLFYGGQLDYKFSLTNRFLLGAESGVYYGKSVVRIQDEEKSGEASNLIIPVLATGTYTFSSGINLFLKAGVAYDNVISSSASNNLHIKWNNDYLGMAAIGFGYKVLGVDFFAQYMHVFGSDEIKLDKDNQAGSIDALTVGVII